MITPHEYLDLDNSVINIAGMMIRIFLEVEMIKYDELYNRIKVLKGEKVQYVYIYALDLLFLLGKINYDKESDVLELVK